MDTNEKRGGARATRRARRLRASCVHTDHRTGGIYIAAPPSATPAGRGLNYRPYFLDSSGQLTLACLPATTTRPPSRCTAHCTLTSCTSTSAAMTTSPRYTVRLIPALAPCRASPPRRSRAAAAAASPPLPAAAPAPRRSAGSRSCRPVAQRNKTEKYHKNIHKRGNVPVTYKPKEKYSVGPIMIGAPLALVLAARLRPPRLLPLRRRRLLLPAAHPDHAPGGPASCTMSGAEPSPGRSAAPGARAFRATTPRRDAE